MATFKMADAGAWVNEKKTRQRAVLQGSVQELARRANLQRADGGRMPRDTGTLRGSFVNSQNGAKLGKDGDAVIYTLAAVADIGQSDFETIQFGWTVEYARRVNSGFIGEDSLGRTFNQTGAFYIEFATDSWQTIVAEQAAKAEASVRSRA